jgi:hypothetical protein
MRHNGIEDLIKYFTTDVRKNERNEHDSQKKNNIKDGY